VARQPERLNEDFRLRGRFWAPGRKRSAVPGTINYTPGMIELELQGNLRHAPVAGAGQSVGLIVGETEAGECTLFESRQIGRRMAGPIVTTRWRPTRLFLGKPRRSNSRFDRAYFAFDELPAWLGSGALDYRTERTAEGRTVHLARHEEPDMIVLDLPSRPYGVAIASSLEVSSAWTPRPSLNWDEDSVLFVQSDTSHGFEWFMDRFTEARELLNLLVGEPVGPTTIVLSSAPGKTSPQPELERSMGDVRVFLPVNGAPRERSSLRTSVAFPYVQVQTRLGQIMENWAAKRELLAPSLALFFGVQIATSLPVEFRFLALTQSLETFHRRMLFGDYLPTNTYQAIRDVLVRAIPQGTADDLRSALKTKLEYGNEYSLRRRLKELRDSLDPDVREHVVPDPTFLGRVVDERNYLTHYPTDGEASMSGTELFYASMRLQALMYVLLLQELDLRGPEVVTALHDTAWFPGYVGYP
jgi:ApeA N-terminal domain 1/Apea-like HEPN